MDAVQLNLLTEDLLRDAAFGLGVLSLVLLLSTGIMVRIYQAFQISCNRRRVNSNTSLSIRFVIAVLLICIVQILAILVWTAALYWSGLVTDLVTGVLYAGSCFTTLGLFTAHLPPGWRSTAFYIAFSGLFSFAVATSAMVSMLSTIGRLQLHRPSSS